MIVKKVINEGEAIPKYYGIAYRDYLRYQAVCYPIVLNLIIRYLREAWACAGLGVVLVKAGLLLGLYS